MIVTFVLLTSLDLYLAMNKQKGETFSEIIRAWGSHAHFIYYIIAFCFGLLVSHWGPK
jgi:hypothetical protein